MALILIGGLIGTSWQALWAMRSERAERQERERAVRAEREAKRQLFNAYVAQATASRRSGWPGQKHYALQAINEAVRLVEPLGLGEESRRTLRNEAISAMTLIDLVPIFRERCLENSKGYFTVSADGQLVAVDDGIDGNVRIHRIDDLEAEFAQVSPIDDSDYAHFLFFDKTGRYLLKGKAISTTWHVTDLAIARDVCVLPNMQRSSAIDFHPQSSQLAAGDTRGDIRVYALPSGEVLRQLSVGHAVTGVKFSPSGRRLAVGVTSGALEVRDAETGEVQFQGPSLEVRGLAWRPDGAWLAAAAASEVHLLEMRGDSRRHIVCSGHSSHVTDVEFHPGNRLLTSASWDGTIRLWDSVTGRQLLRLEGQCVQFVSDGRLLAGRQGLDLVLWEVSTSDVLRWLQKGMTSAVAVAPNDRLIASCHDDGVRFWDLGEVKPAGYLPIGLVNDVAFHPGNGSLFTSGAGGLHRWPVTIEFGKNFQLVRLGPPERIDTGFDDSRLLEFSRDGSMLIVEGSFRDEAVVLPLGVTPGRKVRLTDRRLVNAALSPDGKWAAASCMVGTSVAIWNAHTGELACELPVTSGARIRFSPDNRRLVTNTGPAIGIWEVGSWKLLHEIDGKADYCSGIAFTGDSRIAAVGLFGIGIRLIELETGQPIAMLETAQRLPIYSDLEFSSDDAHLVAAVDHEGLCVWDIRAMREQLASFDLDWDQPPLTEGGKADAKLPIRVQADLGVLDQNHSSDQRHEDDALIRDPND
jgi:WD40 repeat protein